VNILSDPCIPVTSAGGPAMRSVRAVLATAHELDGLACSTATLRIAILRQLLLPIVLDALGPPRSTAELASLLTSGRFDMTRIDPYLDEVESRFHLFDETAPFGQVAGLRTAKDEVKSVSLLQPQAASGNNVTLFSPRSEADVVLLEPAEALWWLLHAQCYDTAAIKSGAVGDEKVKGGKTTGNPTGSLGRFGAVVPTGRNLFETLVLNLPIRENGADPHDSPWWRRGPLTPSWEERPATGVLDLWTWQSRRIRLVRDEQSGLVFGAVVCAGDRLSVFPDFEPHCTWSVTAKPKKGEPPEKPRRTRSGQASWQGFGSLLAVSTLDDHRDGFKTSKLLGQVGDLWDQGLDPTYPLGVDLVGFEYGNQSAVFENLVADSLPLPVKALLAGDEVGPLLEQVARDADALVRAVNILEGDLRRAVGSELIPWDKGQRASSRLIHRLDGVVRRLLRGMQSNPADPGAALDAWRATARRLVYEVRDELVEAAPTDAHRGRPESPDSDRRHNVATAELRFSKNVVDVIGKASKQEATPTEVPA